MSQCVPFTSILLRFNKLIHYLFGSKEDALLYIYWVGSDSTQQGVVIVSDVSLRYQMGGG